MNMHEHCTAPTTCSGGDQHKIPSVGTISTEHKETYTSAKSKGTTGLKCLGYEFHPD